MDATAQKRVRSEAARKANITRRQHMAMFVKALENMGIRKDYPSEKESYYMLYDSPDGGNTVTVFSGGDSHDYVDFHFADGSFRYMEAVVEPEEEVRSGAPHEG